MTSNSPILGIPYPGLSDAVSVETQFDAMADAIDGQIFPRFATPAARGTAMPSPTTGQAAYDTTGNTWLAKQSAAGVWSQFNQLVKVKSVDETVTGSTTLQNDDELFFANIEANATYRLELNVFVQGPTGADFTMGWSLPTSATMHRFMFAKDASAGANNYHISTTSGSSINVLGTNNGDCDWIRDTILVTTVGNSGTIQFRWAQGAAVSSTVVKAKSTLTCRRVA